MAGDDTRVTVHHPSVIPTPTSFLPSLLYGSGPRRVRGQRRRARKVEAAGGGRGEGQINPPEARQRGRRSPRGREEGLGWGSVERVLP